MAAEIIAPQTAVARSGQGQPPDLNSLAEDCRRLAVEKYGRQPSPYIAARLRAGYYSPEDQYEALFNRLVTPSCTWLDIGCGRAPLANNAALSAELAARCRRFVGIDPDASVADNAYVHDWRQACAEDFETTENFDLITARMVVEHVERPREFAAALARLAAPHALVAFLTVNWWSVTALAAYLTPMAVHHWVKKKLWGTKEEDTFPTAYRMNRRATLRRIMSEAGFEEFMFRTLPDASLLWGVPSLRRIELRCYQASRRLRAPYVDSAILAVYRKKA